MSAQPSGPAQNLAFNAYQHAKAEGCAQPNECIAVANRLKAGIRHVCHRRSHGPAVAEHYSAHRRWQQGTKFLTLGRGRCKLRGARLESEREARRCCQAPP